MLVEVRDEKVVVKVDHVILSTDQAKGSRGQTLSRRYRSYTLHQEASRVEETVETENRIIFSSWDNSMTHFSVLQVAAGLALTCEDMRDILRTGE